MHVDWRQNYTVSMVCMYSVYINEIKNSNCTESVNQLSGMHQSFTFQLSWRTSYGFRTDLATQPFFKNTFKNVFFFEAIRWHLSYFGASEKSYFLLLHGGRPHVFLSCFVFQPSEVSMCLILKGAVNDELRSCLVSSDLGKSWPITGRFY